MELYFSEGADLTDREALVKVAAECGLDPDLTRELLTGDRDVDRIRQEAEQGRLRPASTACPASSSAACVAVADEQDPAYLADAMARAADEVDKRESAATAASRRGMNVWSGCPVEPLRETTVACWLAKFERAL